jgi:DNA-binding response OmpR family regulator
MQELDPSDKKRILYVDGYEDNRLLLAHLLEDRDYVCVGAPTLRVGLSMAESKAFDLYILDSWYSDGTGIELCKRIRAFDQSTPIIFFSAWSLESARQEAISAGASAYLLKPALDDVLVFIKILLETQTPNSGNSIVNPQLNRSSKPQSLNCNRPGW